MIEKKAFSGLLARIAKATPILLLAATATADTTYQYTGNAFATIADPDPPSGSYTTSNRVTGTFTVPAPLAPMALTDISAAVVAYSFSDGRNTVTEADSQIFAFLVGVDGNGQIETWWITVGDPDGYGGVGDTRRLIATQNVPGQTITDFGWFFWCFVPLGGSACATNTDQGESDFDPGSWSISASVPAVSWPLGAVAFGAIVLIGARALGRSRVQRRGRGPILGMGAPRIEG